MTRAKLGVALAVAALTGSAAALAQDATAPAAQAVLPPAADSAAPPAADSAAPPPATAASTATTTAPQAASVSGPIAALQQQLKEEGYRPGPVNGVMTEATRRALTAYQRRTGRLPEALAAAGGADPVKRAQADLQRLGLFAGPVDGVIGPGTRDAIIRFEAARRIAIDPRVSDRLLAALEAAGAEAGTSRPSTPGSTAEAAPAAEAQTATPEATGRRLLPPGVNPPPIR
jgi:peptidoglycan hydrolase-like protein with peptidoglycan-binding domain